MLVKQSWMVFMLVVIYLYPVKYEIHVYMYVFYQSCLVLYQPWTSLKVDQSRPGLVLSGPGPGPIQNKPQDCLRLIKTGLEWSQSQSSCHNRDHTYPYSPYPNLSMPIPSHQNHPQAPNATPEPSGSIPSQLTSQQCTPEHSDSLASSQRIPDPMLLWPFLFLTSSRFPTSTPIPDPTPFNLHSFASSLLPTSHQSCDCSWVKPNCVPSLLNVS